MSNSISNDRTEFQEESQNFLLLEISKNIVAVPLSAAIKITTEAAVSLLPFVEEHIDGLTNHDGAIIPQVSLIKYFNRKKIDPKNEAVIVVIEVSNSFCAFKVDAVLDDISVPADKTIYYTEPKRLIDCLPKKAENNSLNARILIAGELGVDDQTISILDFNQFASMVVMPSRQGAVAGKLGELEEATNHEVESDCLVVQVSGERYGFLMSDILTVGKNSVVTKVPGAPDCVTGVAIIHDQAQLILSLHTLLERSKAKKAQVKKENQQTEAYRNTLTIEWKNNAYGLVVESNIEFMSFKASQIQTIENNTNQFSNMIIDEKGVVTVLVELERLFSGSLRKELQGFSPAKEESHQEVESSQSVLHITIADKYFAIPLSYVRKILPYKKPAQLQDQQKIITGIIDIEGKVTSILNASKIFNAEESSQIFNEYVVLTCNDRDWIIPVNSANNVIEIPESNIDMIEGNSSSCISGFSRYEGEMLSVVDVEQMCRAL